MKCLLLALALACSVQAVVLPQTPRALDVLKVWGPTFTESLGFSSAVPAPQVPVPEFTLVPGWWGFLPGSRRGPSLPRIPASRRGSTGTHLNLPPGPRSDTALRAQDERKWVHIGPRQSPDTAQLHPQPGGPRMRAGDSLRREGLQQSRAAAERGRVLGAGLGLKAQETALSSSPPPAAGRAMACRGRGRPGRPGSRRASGGAAAAEDVCQRTAAHSRAQP